MPKAKTTEVADDNIIEAGMGHNSLSPSALRSYCERIEKLIEEREKLSEERKDINADIKQVLEEADHSGFDKKTIKEMIKIRAMDAEDREEQFALRDAYLSALGLLS